MEISRLEGRFEKSSNSHFPLKMFCAGKGGHVFDIATYHLRPSLSLPYEYTFIIISCYSFFSILFLRFCIGIMIIRSFCGDSSNKIKI